MVHQNCICEQNTSGIVLLRTCEKNHPVLKQRQWKNSDSFPIVMIYHEKWSVELK